MYFRSNSKDTLCIVTVYRLPCQSVKDAVVGENTASIRDKGGHFSSYKLKRQIHIKKIQSMRTSNSNETDAELARPIS